MRFFGGVSVSLGHRCGGFCGTVSLGYIFFTVISAVVSDGNFSVFFFLAAISPSSYGWLLEGAASCSTKSMLTPKRNYQVLNTFIYIFTVIPIYPNDRCLLVFFLVFSFRPTVAIIGRAEAMGLHCSCRLLFI